MNQIIFVHKFEDINISVFRNNEAHFTHYLLRKQVHGQPNGSVQMTVNWTKVQTEESEKKFSRLLYQKYSS